MCHFVIINSNSFREAGKTYFKYTLAHHHILLLGCGISTHLKTYLLKGNVLRTDISHYIQYTAGAKKMKFRPQVIAVCNSEHKTDLLRQKGAWAAVTFTNEKSLVNKVLEVSGGKYANVVFEAVGGEVFKAAMHW